jgi:multimeric flavodoxin WrbA
MKVTVLNGSPKGETSITMQYVKYLQQRFPMHEIKIFNISLEIRVIVREEKRFNEIMQSVAKSDIVLWAAPVYFLLVPSQYKKFIELVFERKAVKFFTGKYAAVLMSSIHFFDHTAVNYLNAISDDLGMKYIGSFSTKMYDLMKRDVRRKLDFFGDTMFLHAKEKFPTLKNFGPVTTKPKPYRPGKAVKAVDTRGRAVLVVTDTLDNKTNQGKMIDAFTGALKGGCELLDLSSLNIKGGCLGCMECGYENKCVYDGTDDYRLMFEDKIMKADILVFAGTIKDRYLSSGWKQFFDRSFFRNHVPSLTGKQVGFLISGPLMENRNLREMLEAYAEFQSANFIGIVSDESAKSSEIDTAISALARQAVSASENGYVRPRTYLSTGGMKIFRDEVFGMLGMVFRADDRYYQKNGLYDFPQKKRGLRLQNFVITSLQAFPSFRKGFYKNLKRGMLQPLKKYTKQPGEGA